MWVVNCEWGEIDPTIHNSQLTIHNSPLMSLAIEAPCKINRELRVGPKRSDGYHEILSRMVSIDLADRLEAETAGDFRFSCSAPEVPADESNLVVRAARLLAKRTGRAPTGRLRLVKRVPAGAGLGGGSADAAAALVLLARLWEAHLDQADLFEMAAALGSDVPFFLVGGEADVSGRGECVRVREDRPSVPLLLLVPPFSISTRAVYDAFDRLEPRARLVPERLAVDSSADFFGPNDLASAVHAVEPQMMAYLNSARDVAAEAEITGSGSTIVLRGETGQAEEALRERHPNATIFRARTLSREGYRQIFFGPGGTSWRSRR